MIEWLQSFQGITTLSIGGISITGAAGMLIYVIKQSSTMRNVKDMVEMIKQTKTMLDKERETSAIEKEARIKAELSLDEKELEALKASEVQALLLKSVSIIIAASSGIDSVSKIEMVNDLKTLQTTMKKEVSKVVEKVKEEVVQTVEVVKEESKKEVETFLDKAVSETSSLLEKYSKK